MTTHDALIAEARVRSGVLQVSEEAQYGATAD